MKTLLLIGALALGVHAAFTIKLINPKPCGFVQQVIVVDYDQDEKADVIRYIRPQKDEREEDRKAVYLYRGPTAYLEWQAGLISLGIPDSKPKPDAKPPRADEIGQIRPFGSSLSFIPIEDGRLKKAFEGGDKMLRAYVRDGTITEQTKKKHMGWIKDRFQDIEPDRRLACADECNCTNELPAYYIR